MTTTTRPARATRSRHYVATTLVPRVVGNLPKGSTIYVARVDAKTWHVTSGGIAYDVHGLIHHADVARQLRLVTDEWGPIPAPSRVAYTLREDHLWPRWGEKVDPASEGRRPNPRGPLDGTAEAQALRERADAAADHAAERQAEDAWLRAAELPSDY